MLAVDKKLPAATDTFCPVGESLGSSSLQKTIFSGPCPSLILLKILCVVFVSFLSFMVERIERIETY